MSILRNLAEKNKISSVVNYCIRKAKLLTEATHKMLVNVITDGPSCKPPALVPVRTAINMLYITYFYVIFLCSRVTVWLSGNGAHIKHSYSTSSRVSADMDLAIHLSQLSLAIPLQCPQ